MGLDQKIFELTKVEKLKKINEIDVWNKYSKFNFVNGMAFLPVLDLNQELFDYERMEKDGFRTVKEFRKFHELQGWFEKNYKIKNSGKVLFTTNNINKLLSDIDSKKLTICEGSYYGNQTATNDEYESLKQILLSIRNEVAQGKTYLYTCWY